MRDERMRHQDNHGNEGLLTPGSVQWMTAGRGLVHSEMPEQASGRMRGFQLWAQRIRLRLRGRRDAGRGRSRARAAGADLAMLGGGDLLQLQAGNAGARLILVASRPLREPVARHGPFVMNTREELMQAFVDFQEVRF